MNVRGVPEKVKDKFGLAVIFFFSKVLALWRRF